jgi:hypothetical protein
MGGFKTRPYENNALIRSTFNFLKSSIIKSAFDKSWSQEFLFANPTHFMPAALAAATP